MRREHILARMLRAVSGMTQQELAEETGLHPSEIAAFELGKVVPGREHLERMAAAVGLTVSTMDETLRFLDSLRRPRQRRGEDARALLDGIVDGVRSEMEDAYRRLLTLPPPDGLPE